MWRVALCACAALALVIANPAAPAVDEDVDEVYDQRQNGSENLRVSVSDVSVLVAPADGLGDAFTNLLMGTALLKDSAGAQRSRLKLSSLLHPLVSRIEPGRTSHPHH